MKVTLKTARKYQEGGAMPVELAAPEEAMPAEGGAPEEGGLQDPIMMLAQMAAQALLTLDCQMMAQVCEGFLQLVQGAAYGGAPLGQPMYRKGGHFVKRVRR